MRSINGFRMAACALAVGVLAACGGGNGGGELASPATPADAVSTLRARALAAAATQVAPEEAARQLMDFAEATFKEYFPSHQPTQVLEPFRYRYYAQTGVYLGVVVSAANGYEMLGVYVMGGSFGNEPLYVGPLARYITPLPPVTGPGPTGSSNGCFEVRDHDPFAPGARMVEVIRTEGPAPMTTTFETRTVGPASFEGHAAVEMRHAWAEGDLRNGLPDSAWQTHDSRSYLAATGPAETTHYGETTAIDRSDSVPGGGTVSTSSRSRMVYDPPWVDRQGQLPLGGSLSQTTRTRTTGSSTTTVTGGPVVIPPVVTGPTETIADGTPTTVTFVRRERVTVPVGSFDACVYQYDTALSTGQVWIADGRGFNLKTTGTSAGVTSTTVTLAVSINGRPVVP